MNNVIFYCISTLNVRSFLMDASLVKNSYCHCQRVREVLNCVFVPPENAKVIAIIVAIK